MANKLMSEQYQKQNLFAAEEDAELFAEPETKLVICSPPRTASTFLCRALTVAGIAKPAEYFGTDPERRIRLRTHLAKSMDQYTVDAEYFNDILRRRCFNGLFATKLQYWQLKRLLRSRLSGQLFEGAHVVYLTRDDLRDQMVSQAVANLTQRWGEVGGANGEALYFSDAQLREAACNALHFLLDELRGFDEFFALNNIRPLRIRSEDVADKPLENVEQFAALTGHEVKHKQALEEYFAARSRYKTDSKIKDRLRNVVLEQMNAEDEFIRTQESWPIYRWPSRLLKNARKRRSGRIL